MKKLTRRSFIKLSSATAAGALLTASGCAGAPTPTSTPVPTAVPTSAGTATPAMPPTATPAPIDTVGPTLSPAEKATQAYLKTYRRLEIIKFHPDTKSQVIRARNSQVWQGDKVSPEIVRKLVDDAMLKLTGKPDIKSAWQALFLPTERIAIKVNAFMNSVIWTHVELVKAVTDGLQEAGIPAGHIFIYDANTSELKDAGFPVNKDGPGVRCFGSDSDYSSDWRAGSATVKLSDILTSCDALINMPVLKSHMLAGYTFALKNHLGSVNSPGSLHFFEASLPGLNGLKPIKDATRLVIGDCIHANRKWSNSWPYWKADTKGDSILVGYDPAACDIVAMQMLVKMIEDNGDNSAMIAGMSADWMAAIEKAGLGTMNMDNIQLLEV